MAQDRIDSDLLTSLGLSEEDVQKFDREKLKEKQEMDEARKRGGQYYLSRSGLTPQQLYAMTQDEARRFREVVVGEKFFRFQGEGNPGLPNLLYIPDEMFNQFQTLPDNKIVSSWLRGFGMAALGLNQLNPAINAFDILTGGKVMEDEEIAGRLREAAKENRSIGVEIAKKIQTRRKLRRPSLSPTDTAPAGPEPPPTD